MSKMKKMKEIKEQNKEVRIRIGEEWGGEAEGILTERDPREGEALGLMRIASSSIDSREGDSLGEVRWFVKVDDSEI